MRPLKHCATAAAILLALCISATALAAADSGIASIDLGGKTSGISFQGVVGREQVLIQAKLGVTTELNRRSQSALTRVNSPKGNSSEL